MKLQRRTLNRTRKFATFMGFAAVVLLLAMTFAFNQKREAVITSYSIHYTKLYDLYSYDSPYSLVLLPLGMILIFIGTLVGTFLLQRMGIADALPYILLLGINKIIYEVAKNSLQIPSFRTIYHTMDVRFLQLAIPRVEGLIVMVGLTVSGVLLFFTRRYLSGILLFVPVGIIICIVWFFLAVKLIQRNNFV